MIPQGYDLHERVVELVRVGYQLRPKTLHPFQRKGHIHHYFPDLFGVFQIRKDTDAVGGFDGAAK